MDNPKPLGFGELPEGIKGRGLEISNFVIMEMYAWVMADRSLRVRGEAVECDPFYEATDAGYEAALLQMETNCAMFGMNPLHVEQGNVSVICRIATPPMDFDDNASRVFELHRMFADTPEARKIFKDIPMLSVMK